MSRVLIALTLAALLAAVIIEATPMIYKKVDGQKYEPDWVAVSSTVIPLTEYRVSVGGGGSAKSMSPADEEYRRAYLLHQKLVAASVKKSKDGNVETAARVQQDPDTLITANKRKAN